MSDLESFTDRELVDKLIERGVAIEIEASVSVTEEVMATHDDWRRPIDESVIQELIHAELFTKAVERGEVAGDGYTKVWHRVIVIKPGMVQRHDKP